jgi:acyl-CoA synthetase (AMP-forming)/AMP-acid ligase II
VLDELVRAAATQAPERAVVVSPRGELSYVECLTRTEAVAAGLRARRVQRFGCVFESPLDTVVAVCAAAAAGSEICVYPRDPGAGGHARLASRFGHTTVASDGTAAIDGVTMVSLDELEAAGAASEGSTSESGPSPRQFPVLILTTGTTGEQKGARHDWARLLQGVRHGDLRPGTRWLLAYNLNQFAGVQVLLHVLASGGTLVEPASRRADDAIAAIREHRVTHASATPTFWRLLAGRIDGARAAELPLEQITLGGEAAGGPLLDRLHELFAGVRISHVYAGTEFGSVVSVRDGQSGLPVSVLEREEDADVQFRIEDGELQIRSRVGMIGYHAAEETHGAWRATGDLVEIRGGRIEFVGRTTEIINVGGAKIHPLPVEERISSVDGVELVAVYGRSNAVTGQIVAADVVPAPGADTDELEQQIREACQALPAAGRPRRIRFVPELEIRGNKLVRHEV